MYCNYQGTNMFNTFSYFMDQEFTFLTDIQIAFYEFKFAAYAFLSTVMIYWKKF